MPHDQKGRGEAKRDDQQADTHRGKETEMTGQAETTGRAETTAATAILGEATTALHETAPTAVRHAVLKTATFLELVVSSEDEQGRQSSSPFKAPHRANHSFLLSKCTREDVAKNNPTTAYKKVSETLLQRFGNFFVDLESVMVNAQVDKQKYRA